MFRFPQRKTHLVAYFALTVWLVAFMGCASKKPSSASPAVFKESESESAAELEKPRSLPPGRVSSRPRSYNSTAATTPDQADWVYKKSAPKQPPLSMFEESILLGQVRATLKKVSEGANVESVKVRNRTALLGVNNSVNSDAARRIGESLLNQTRLEEVRLKPTL